MNIDKIRRFVVATLELRGNVPVETEQEIDSYRYLDLGHIDSFGLMRFVAELEDHFGVVFEPEHLQSQEFRTVGGVCHLIASLQSSK